MSYRALCNKYYNYLHIGSSVPLSIRAPLVIFEILRLYIIGFTRHKFYEKPLESNNCNKCKCYWNGTICRSTCLGIPPSRSSFRSNRQPK